jgi:hypothetical protein
LRPSARSSLRGFRPPRVRIDRILRRALTCGSVSVLAVFL